MSENEIKKQAIYLYVIFFVKRQSLKKRTPRDFHFVSHKTQKHTQQY